MTIRKIKYGGTRKRSGGTRKRIGGRRRKAKGGRRSIRRGGRRSVRRGGGILATAALPFGLFGLQKLFQKGRTRRQVRKVQKSLKKDLRKLDVRRLLKK